MKFLLSAFFSFISFCVFIRNDSIQKEAIFTNVGIGTHTIYARDLLNCNTITQQEIVIGYPKYFTPNGDGYNDEFQIENIHLYPRAVVQIFNRWGQLLYEDLGINGFWDGKYNGTEVPEGVYFYIISLNDSSQQTLKSYITVLR